MTSYGQERQNIAERFQNHTTTTFMESGTIENPSDWVSYKWQQLVVANNVTVAKVDKGIKLTSPASGNSGAILAKNVKPLISGSPYTESMFKVLFECKANSHAHFGVCSGLLGSSEAGYMAVAIFYSSVTNKFYVNVHPSSSGITTITKTVDDSYVDILFESDEITNIDTSQYNTYEFNIMFSKDEATGTKLRLVCKVNSKVKEVSDICLDSTNDFLADFQSDGAHPVVYIEPGSYEFELAQVMVKR